MQQHTNTQEEAFSASLYCASMQTSPVSSLPLCPPHSRMFAAKILNAGWHNAFFLPPPPLLFPFPLECSVSINRKAVRVKSRNSLSHYNVNRSPNTAECHQSQLSNIRGENSSLQRVPDLLEACLHSTGVWETLREQLSCIAQ